MTCARSLGARTFGLILAAATLVAAVPVPVDHHADHRDEAVHLEHDHGGHGGLLEQDEARVPAPHVPVAVRTVELELPESPVTRSPRPIPDDVLLPLGRAPPPDLPRAPPHPS